MSLLSTFRLIQIPKRIIIPIQYNIQVNGYAIPGMALGKGKKLGKTKGPVMEKKKLPVEADANILTKYCCGTNLLREGGQDVELRPDSEYPEWLWNIRTGPLPPIEELDPNTKQYWKRLRRDAIRRTNKLLSLKQF